MLAAARAFAVMSVPIKLVMVMTVVNVVNMVIMLDTFVATAFAVNMSVVFVVLMMMAMVVVPFVRVM